jgi:hypothetical protein
MIKSEKRRERTERNVKKDRMKDPGQNIIDKKGRRRTGKRA